MDKGNNRTRASYRTAGVPVSSLLTFFAHLLFIAITTLLLVWLLHFRDGISFSSSNKLKLFNYFVSLLVFIFPGVQNWRRARLAPWHVLYGITIFFMAIVSTETGLIEKFTTLGLQKGQEALVINFTGLLVLLFGISIGLVVLLPVSYY
ncbi:unnamed protein product [Withania somnifera]